MCISVEVLRRVVRIVDIVFVLGCVCEVYVLFG